jgi:hypothetical protein
MYPIQELAQQRIEELREVADELRRGRAPRVRSDEASPRRPMPAMAAAPARRIAAADTCSGTPSVAAGLR